MENKFKMACSESINHLSAAITSTNTAMCLESMHNALDSFNTALALITARVKKEAGL